MDNPDFFFNGALIHYKFRSALKDWEVLIPNIKEAMIKSPESFCMSEDTKWDEPDEVEPIIGKSGCVLSSKHQQNNG